MTFSPISRTAPLARFTRRAALALAAAPLLIGSAMAQQAAWPDKMVKLVVPFPAGGPTDTASRIVGQKLGERLKQTVLIENKAGASGSIAAAQVSKSPADGYTLMMLATPTMLAPHLYKKAGYDTVKDFTPVATVYDLPIVVVVNPKLLPDVTDLKGLIANAKAQKTPLNYTSSGAGSFGHLSMELLKQMASFDMQHVPYKGGVPAITDTIGGQVPVMYADLVAALPHIQAGKLAPLGTPKAVVDRIANEVQQILAEKEVQDKLLNAGAIAHFQTPAQLGQRVQQDYTRWGQLIRDKGIASE